MGRIIDFVRLITEENKKQNIVSRRSEDADLLLHVEDSLKVMEYMDLKDLSCIDIGSGGGFPAIPLAIKNGETKLTLVESEGKKAEFLKACVEQLELKNCKVFHERIEMMGRSEMWRETYDIATARGVAEMNVLLEWALPMVKVGGFFIAWKGPNLDVELERAEGAMGLLGGILSRIEKYELDAKARNLVFIKKIKECPEKYPRRGGLARKRPL
ncbi:MAG: 16S rRNA (guanine(527)-N(7))-methyltransferase RsmG [Acidobacteriota bacterium]